MCQITQMCTFVRWRQSTVLSCRPSGDGCQSSTVGDMYRGEQSVDECYITAWNLTKTKRSSSGLAPVFNCPRFSARRSQWEALTFRYLLKPCVCESCLTVSWPLLFTSAVWQMFLSSATDEDSAPVAHRRCSEYNGALCLLQVELITATVLFSVQVPFTFDLCKMHSMQLLDMCCTSGSLTINCCVY